MYIIVYLYNNIHKTSIFTNQTLNYLKYTSFTIYTNIYKYTYIYTYIYTNIYKYIYIYIYIFIFIWMYMVRHMVIYKWSGSSKDRLRKLLAGPSAWGPSGVPPGPGGISKGWFRFATTEAWYLVDENLGGDGLALSRFYWIGNSRYWLFCGIHRSS